MREKLLTEFMMQAPHQPATNYWRAIEIHEVVKYDLPHGMGLDLGCGDGHLMAITLKYAGARDLVGVDIDPLETAQAERRGVYRKVFTTSGDNLPFGGGEIDYVFSNSVLEHIENIQGSLSEVSRVLRAGGRFIFTVPGPDFHACLKGPADPGKRERYLRETDARCRHLRYWSATRWSQALATAGLVMVHSHEYLGRAQVQRWEFLARCTSGVLYKIAGGRRQPIEIQRRLKIRNIHLPRLAAELAANAASAGTQREGSPYGCLLIEAQKVRGE